MDNFKDSEDVQPAPVVPDEVKGHKRGRTKKGEAQSQTKDAIAQRLSRAKKQAKAFELLSPEERFRKRLEAQQDVWNSNREALSPEDEKELNEQIVEHNTMVEFLEAGLRVMRHNQIEDGFSWPEAFCSIEDYIKSHPLRDDNFVFSDSLLDNPQIHARDFSSRERKFGLPSTIPSGVYQDVLYEFSKWLHVHHNELKHATPEIWEATDRAIRENRFGFLRNWKNENRSTPVPVAPPKLHLPPEHKYLSPAEARHQMQVERALNQVNLERNNPSVVHPAQSPQNLRDRRQFNHTPQAQQTPLNEMTLSPQARQIPAPPPPKQRPLTPEETTSQLLQTYLFMRLSEMKEEEK